MNIERLKEVSRIFCQAEAELIKILSEEKPDPYAELKEAQAQGKVIQWQNKHNSWTEYNPQIHAYPGRFPEIQWRIKPEEPWTLTRELPGFRALSDGEEWHNSGWTKEMLPDGCRPQLIGESGEGEISGDRGKTWTRDTSPDGKIDSYYTCHYRTKRPLPILTPAQISEGWKEWHGGENPAPGKRVIIMCRDFEIPVWQIKGSPSNQLHWIHNLHSEHSDGDIIAYRIIEPKLVQLGPDDVPPGSVFRFKIHEDASYYIPSYVSSPLDGIYFSDTSNFHRNYNSLMEGAEINRSIPLTGKWDATAWEPCSKEEKQ